LDEQLGQGRQMPFPELGNAVVVRMLIAGQDAERDIPIRRALDLPRRGHAGAVRVEQQLHHHRRVIGWLTPAVAHLVGRIDG
jgi:hypothetical protein